MNAKRTYKYLDVIILLDVTMMVITTASVGKIIQFFIFTPSVSALYIPVTYLCGDILTEVYGYKHARRAMWIVILSMILTALILQIVVLLPPASGFANNDAFTIVFGQAPRIAIGGFIAFFAGQFVNDIVLAKMKLLTKGKYLWTRTIGSTIFGQFFDTTLFYAIALSNVIPAGLLIKAILSGWFLKVLVEVVMTPITYYLIQKLKKVESEDYFDRSTNFNPLIVDFRNSS